MTKSAAATTVASLSGSAYGAATGKVLGVVETGVGTAKEGKARVVAVALEAVQSVQEVKAEAHHHNLLCMGS